MLLLAVVVVMTAGLDWVTDVGSGLEVEPVCWTVVHGYMA